MNIFGNDIKCCCQGYATNKCIHLLDVLDWVILEVWSLGIRMDMQDIYRGEFLGSDSKGESRKQDWAEGDLHPLWGESWNGDESSEQTHEDPVGARQPYLFLLISSTSTGCSHPQKSSCLCQQREISGKVVWWNLASQLGWGIVPPTKS